MKLRFFISLFALLAAASCDTPRYVDYFPYYDSGLAKPRVALVPMIDHSSKKLPCDVSEQFTRGICFEMMDHGELYLLPVKDVAERVAAQGTFDFFIKDQKLSEIFCDADFVVIMELVQHERLAVCEPDATGKCCFDDYRCHDTLSMKIRVRIVDVRRKCPVVILQEVVSCSYKVPCERQDLCRGIPCVDRPEYRMSPTGQAHQRMIVRIVERLEGIIKSVR